MRYLSVCSGIEAASVAWHPLGWTPAAFSEIDAFPRALLKHHYPAVPLHGDFTTIQGDEYGPIDLLVGGTPCQSFSIAGLRGGIHDGRGNLALEFLRLLDRTRPCWVVWENVPGVFSSTSHDAPDPSPPDIDLDADDAPADGEEVVVEDEYDADESHALACFMAGLRELGYGFAWRTLDAQFFGVPQRRRRIFVVGYLGDWRRAAAVLFERQSLSGDHSPSRKAGQGTAGSLAARAGGGGWPDGGDGRHDQLIAGTVSSKWSKGSGDPAGDECQNLVAHALRAEGHDASEDGTGRGTPIIPVEHPFTLASRGRGDGHNLEYRQDGKANAILTPNGGRGGIGVGAIAFTAKDYGADALNDCSPTLRSGSFDESHSNGGVMPAIAHMSAVRRLTPRECERLQGFPDDYTRVPYRGKPAADAPRYKALGNSMAVPVMRWIGERIAKVEAISAEIEAAA